MDGPVPVELYVIIIRYGGPIAIFTHIPPAFVETGSTFAPVSELLTFTQRVMVHGEPMVNAGTL